MIALLNTDTSLTITKNTIPEFASMNANFILYVSKSVLDWMTSDCELILVCYNSEKNFVSSKLVQTESNKENYLKYIVSTDSDFSLENGNYNTFVFLINPITNTHISSSISTFQVTTSSESMIFEKIGNNIFDEIYTSVKGMKSDIENYLETIKKLTELNIKINNDIEKKVGERNG